MVDHFSLPIDQTLFDLLLHTIETKWQIKQITLSHIDINDSQLSQLITHMKQTLEQVTISKSITSIHCLCDCPKLNYIVLHCLPALSVDSFLSDLSFIAQQCPIKYLSMSKIYLLEKWQNEISKQHLPEQLLRQLQHKCDYLQIDEWTYAYDPFEHE